MRHPAEPHPMPNEAVRESRDLFARWLDDCSISPADPKWAYRAAELCGYSVHHLANVKSGKLVMSPAMRRKLYDARSKVERHAREMATLVAV